MDFNDEQVLEQELQELEKSINVNLNTDQPQPKKQNIFEEALQKKKSEEKFENQVNLMDPKIVKQGKILQKTV